MAVQASDIEYRLSNPDLTSGDSGAQADPDASLGGFMSTTEIVDATKGNLFRSTTAAEGETGITLYRCLFVTNKHATDTAEACRAYIPSQTAGGGLVAIGLDPVGVVAGNSGSAQAAVIADEETAPAGVTFSAPSTYETGLVIGNMAPDQCIGIWLRLTVAENAAALADDGALVEIGGVSDG